MRKIISILSFILVVVFVCCAVFVFPDWTTRQINKVKGMYCVYKGDKALRKAKVQKAIDLYNKGLKLYPEHYGAWYNLGNIYVLYEDYFSAVDAYENAIKYNSKYVMARMNYGIVSAEKLGDFDGAIEQYKNIISIKRWLLYIPFIYSNKLSTKVNRGRAWYNMGIAYRQKSIYLSDDNLAVQKKYLEQAIDAYQHAVKILKKDYDARYNLALAQHLYGDYTNAGLNYCRAIELAPMNYEAHYNLAILLRHLRYYKESLAEMQKATSLITTGDGMSNRQRYIFDVMNDVTRTILANTDGRRYIEELDRENEESLPVTYVNGKIVATAALDKAILKNFRTCGSKKIFLEEIEDMKDLK